MVAAERWVEDVLHRKKSKSHFSFLELSDIFCSFDLNFPIECDDEFWAVDDPEVPFRQPPGLPTQISFFVWMIKLENIKERAIRKPVRNFITYARYIFNLIDTNSQLPRWSKAILLKTLKSLDSMLRTPR